MGPRMPRDRQIRVQRCTTRIVAAVMIAQFVNLGVAVVAPRDAVVRPGGLDLVVFQFAVFEAVLLVSGLEKTAAAAAAVIVGAVGHHVDEVFLTHHRFDHKAQVFGDGVAIAFANDLAGILNRKLDLQVLVPVRVDLQFSLADPFGVVFINIFDFKIVRDVEFFQSCQD